MANTYDRTQLDQDKNKVRLLINDVDVDEFIYHDEEVDALLEMKGHVLLAAATALESIAANEVLVQKRIKILDLQTDGPAESAELRQLAKQMRNDYEGLESDDAGFEVASFHDGLFATRQLWWNEVLMKYNLTGYLV